MTSDPEPVSDADPGTGRSGGQVSAVSSMEGGPEAISPEDSVAGAEPGESGRADEGPTGPDAVTNDRRRDRHPDKGDVDTTG